MKWYDEVKYSTEFVRKLVRRWYIFFFAADVLLENKVTIAGVYSSPALRCLQTATEIYQGKGIFVLTKYKMDGILQWIKKNIIDMDFCLRNLTSNWSIYLHLSSFF